MTFLERLKIVILLREMLSRSGVLVSGFDFSWTKYRAACHLNYLWNKNVIDSMIDNVILKKKVA